MDGIIGGILTRFAAKRRPRDRATPLLVELLQPAEGEVLESYTEGAFDFAVRRSEGTTNYEAMPNLSPQELAAMRRAVSVICETLEPAKIDPLTFERLVDVLSQSAAQELAGVRNAARLKELALLAAFEAIGMPTVLALSSDRFLSEFYLDDPGCPLYLDHSRHGRCETRIYLTERERKAIETHMDTFKGYTLDLSTPSLKNELEVRGSRLRISVDLAPLAVNGFALDIRKLNSSYFSIKELIVKDVLSLEAASFLLAALESGMNATIVGETGTGKTTLLNALDESLDPRFRRVYVEDAVETRDLLEKGYHQLKLKVDPFDRAAHASRTKAIEIVKILHRSPDIVILGEIQSPEHSRAFFQALSSGVRGMQTFHASSLEQAVRRWTENHGISKSSMLDLDVLVQMYRPAKLGSARYVSRVAAMVSGEDGDPHIRDIYLRDREFRLRRIVAWERLAPMRGAGDSVKLEGAVAAIQAKLESERRARP